MQPSDDLECHPLIGRKKTMLKPLIHQGVCLAIGGSCPLHLLCADLLTLFHGFFHILPERDTAVRVRVRVLVCASIRNGAREPP